MTKHAQLDLFRTLSPLPLPPRDRTYGLTVQLPKLCRCRGQFASISTGGGPHAASLICCKCGVQRGWVSHATHKFLTEIVNKFGRPTEPIVLRRTGGAS
jgi:hypothetical protein